MKPVSILPSLSSQDVDIKAKDDSSLLGGKAKGDDFSRLVEQHAGQDKHDRNSVETGTAKNGTIQAGSGNKDALVESSRQESDSLVEGSAGAHQEKQTTKSSQDNAEFDELQPNKANELSADSSTDNVTNDSDFNDSEQFISLLYTSDQTLTANTDKTPSPQDLTSQQGTVNVSRVVSTDKVPGNDELSLTSEHKLKSFSQEELLIRANLKRDAVLPQTNEQVVKEYQQGLKSQQAMASTQNLSNEYILSSANSAVEEITEGDMAGVKAEHKVFELATNTSVNSKQQSLDNVAVDLIRQASTFVDKKAINTLETKIDLGKESAKLSDVASKQVELATTNSTLLGESKKLGSSTDSLSDTDKIKVNVANNIGEQLGKNNTDKLTAEQKSIMMDAKAVSESITADQSTSKAPNVNVAKIHGSDELAKTQTQKIAVPLSDDEQKAIEALGEDLVDAGQLTSKTDEPLIKATTKAIDPMSVRATSELHAQSIQSTQAKQNNDAYMEFQSSEVLNHNVAGDTAHIQKNNVQLQQETISMFRKDFTDAVKDKVMLMINQKIQQFDITLDPPEFGNMQVRVNLQGEQASVNFTVQNQQAKEALEQNMDKLKDMLAEQGVDVGGANVEQQNQEENSNAEQGTQGNVNSRLAGNEQVDEDNVQHVLSTNLFNSSASGVDYYA